ncbi:hypothetical protein [Rhodoflexus sp.]
MRILVVISTWFWLVWSLHADHYQIRPVYEINDYEDFTLQEDNLPSSLISWLDNNQPNTNTGKRQRISQEENRQPSSEFSCIFYPATAIFLHDAKAVVQAAAIQQLYSNISVKIFLYTCRLRL